jgi:hypothetical protein
VFATIAHSEFCPAGNVRLDLRTGRYAMTPRAAQRVCGKAGLERPLMTGRLVGKPLAAVRAAYRAILDNGFVSPYCQGGRHPDMIVISNAGTPTLVVATGAFTGTAPADLTCWSDSAHALERALDDAFRFAQQR